MINSPSALKSVFLASRPKTWIAGISPVVIGAALAYKDGSLSISLFLYSLLFSLLVQIGTNFSNDYFDFLKGADNDQRIGPPRAVAMGWISPKAMHNLSLLAFAASFAASIPLVLACGLWSLAFVISSIGFGMLYTGGPRPLGYLGLGELFVLTYFGPVAVLGTYFVQRHTITLDAIFLSLSPGFIASAILIANNLRDEKTDRIAKKNTLVVRFGTYFGQYEYAVCLIAGILLPNAAGYYSPLFCLALGYILVKQAFSDAEKAPLLPKTALVLAILTFAIVLESCKSAVTAPF